MIASAWKVNFLWFFHPYCIFNNMAINNVRFFMQLTFILHLKVYCVHIFSMLESFFSFVFVLMYVSALCMFNKKKVSRQFVGDLHIWTGFFFIFIIRLVQFRFDDVNELQKTMPRTIIVPHKRGAEQNANEKFDRKPKTNFRWLQSNNEKSPLYPPPPTPRRYYCCCRFGSFFSFLSKSEQWEVNRKNRLK